MTPAPPGRRSTKPPAPRPSGACCLRRIGPARPAPGFRDGRAGRATLFGRSEADRDPFDAGRDDQQVGSRARAPAAPTRGPCRPRPRCRRAPRPSSRTTGMPPPPAATTTAPWSHSAPMIGSSTISPAAARRPCAASRDRHLRRSSSRARFGETLRRGFVHERADRLRRDRRRPDRRATTTVCVTIATTGRSTTAPAQFVAQRLEEHVADRALRVGDGVVHRDGVDLVVGELRAAQDEADLRAVAVGDDEVPARVDQVDEMRGDRAARSRTGRGSIVLLVAHQRVAAERDDRQSAHGVTALLRLSWSQRARRSRR